MDAALLGRLTGKPEAIEDVVSGRLDRRLAALLTELLGWCTVELGYVKTGHPMGPTSPVGRVNTHYFYCAADLHAIDGHPVGIRPIHPRVVEVGRRLLSIPVDQRPDSVMGPAEWHRALGGGAVTGFRDDDHANAIHHDHLHLGFTPGATRAVG